jgi:hypothetical protein
MRGERHHHGGNVCGLLCWGLRYFSYYSYSRKPTGREFFVPTRTLIVVFLLKPPWYSAQNVMVSTSLLLWWSWKGITSSVLMSAGGFRIKFQATTYPLPPPPLSSHFSPSWKLLYFLFKKSTNILPFQDEQMICTTYPDMVDRLPLPSALKPWGKQGGALDIVRAKAGSYSCHHEGMICIDSSVGIIFLWSSPTIDWVLFAPHGWRREAS